VTRHVSLAEYLWLAEQVAGIDANTQAKIGWSSWRTRTSFRPTMARRISLGSVMT
jgi:hypothetical protein